MIASAFWQ